MKKIKFCTFGCKVNQYETEAMRELLAQNGFIDVGLHDTPDYIVINSCAVTAEGERKVRQTLRKLRKTYPLSVIMLTGCISQAFPEKANELLEADIVCGNGDVTDACNKLMEYSGGRVVEVKPHYVGEKYNTPTVSGMYGRTRAYMKIQDGCDRFCTYCIIPYSRGRIRSRSVESIRHEAEVLACAGYTEIVLTGINLSAFGRDTGEGFADAVKAAAEPSGIKRVRLGSLEPDYMTDDLLDKLSNIPKLCPQFHLSLQSGCDDTLKRMNRHYDFRFYSELVNRIRARFPNCAITTDVMVGFAGESEDNFKESLRNVESIGFAKIHVFPYSVRPGTVAAKYTGQLTSKIKEERSKIMCSLAEKSQTKFLATQVGKVYPVLFESGKNGVFEGSTPNNSRVVLKCENDISGKIIDIMITDVEDFALVGYPV